MLRPSFLILVALATVAPPAHAGDGNIEALRRRATTGDFEDRAALCAALVRSGRTDDPEILKLALTHPTFDIKEEHPYLLKSTHEILQGFGINSWKFGRDTTTAYSLDLNHPQAFLAIETISNLMRSGEISKIFQILERGSQVNDYAEIRVEADFPTAFGMRLFLILKRRAFSDDGDKYQVTGVLPLTTFFDEYSLSTYTTDPTSIATIWLDRIRLGLNRLIEDGRSAAESPGHADAELTPIIEALQKIEVLQGRL